MGPTSVTGLYVQLLEYVNSTSYLVAEKVLKRAGCSDGKCKCLMLACNVK